jgi:inhibitor of cysteine peptidase
MSAQNDVVSSDPTANGKAVNLTVGQTLEFQLAENRTTGYRWSVSSDGAPAGALIENSFGTEAGPPGRGRGHPWRFKAIRPGDGTIELVDRRPWEQDRPPARTFPLHVHVAEGQG